MKILKFTLIFLLVLVICYIYHFNPSQAEVVFSKGSSFKATMALILVITFSAGVLFTLFFALLAGIRIQFRTKKIEREKRMIDDHLQLIDKARSSQALGNLDDAETLFSKIICKDPNNIGARVALSKTFKDRGDNENALRVLDEARAEDKKNPELLLAASDLNASLGNYTAAYDNASMVLKMMPKNKFALERLAEDCLPLERFSEAAEHLRELIRLSVGEDQLEFQDRLAEVEFMAAAKIDDDSEFKATIKDILSRHKDFVPALEALADVEEALGNCDKAEAALLRAFAISPSSELLEKLGKMWIKANNPKKAVAALEKVIKDLEKSEHDTSPARLALGLIQLELENIEAAENALKPILADDKTHLAGVDVLEAKLLARRGNKDLAFKKLMELVEKSPSCSCN